MLKALSSDSITLHLITEDNLSEVYQRFLGFIDSKSMLNEMMQNHLPRDEKGQQTNYGFFTTLNDHLAGMSVLTIDSWPLRIGSTGADVFEHMRGRGVTPGSKPHLFYLAFELLGLNRVATGCLVSNLASKRSIEKTAGFELEGITRQSGINEQGEFEDEYINAITRQIGYDSTRKLSFKLLFKVLLCSLHGILISITLHCVKLDMRCYCTIASI